MSTFDPNAFLNTEVKGELDTSLPPIPEGTWDAQVDKVAARAVTDRNGNQRAIMDVTWAVLNDEVKKATTMEKPTVRQSVFLDVNEQGALDFSKGKNVQLGRLRDAVGQNTNKVWSPTMLEGQIAKVVTKQRPDENDPEIIYSDVKRVLPA